LGPRHRLDVAGSLKRISAPARRLLSRVRALPSPAFKVSHERDASWNGKTAKKAKPTQKAFSLFEEFKAFAFKGNVIDLAVGVIIGAAFGKIIDALVKDLLMPLIGVLVPGEQGYLGWKWVINGKEIPYGLFLGEVVNFLIVALALFFFIVKFLGWVMRTKKQEAAAAPPLTKDQELLAEIRDLLQKQQAPHDVARTM
jgi:large conductance mechanosensitive channel